MTTVQVLTIFLLFLTAIIAYGWWQMRLELRQRVGLNSFIKRAVDQFVAFDEAFAQVTSVFNEAATTIQTFRDAFVEETPE